MQLAPSGTDRAEAEALAALLASDRLARATYAATGVDDPGLVFADANGNEVHPHALSQAFDRIVRRAMPIISLHELYQRFAISGVARSCRSGPLV